MCESQLQVNSSVGAKERYGAIHRGDGIADTDMKSA